MAENEKEDIHKIIEEGIAKGIKAAIAPIYWMIGVPMLTFLIILVSITGPMQDRLSKVIESDAEKVKSTEAYSNFLTKPQYNQLEKETSIHIAEMILHPESIKAIIQESDRHRADNLEIRYRGASE